MPDTETEFLRHTVATLAYRAAKAMRGAPESFARFSAGESGRTPLEIVAHMGDLFDWALSMAEGDAMWVAYEPTSWDETCRRFFESLRRFDDRLASSEPIKYDFTRLFQGPIADALTHTGQLTMLRRLHGSPIKGESYNRAEIIIGRVGPDQIPPDPRNEFS